MSKEALVTFLESDKVCALSSLVAERVLHSAAMHFSFEPDPLAFYFSADTAQRKFELIARSGSTPASLVVGLSEEVWVTCQISGELSRVPDGDVPRVKNLHYARIPSAKQFEDLPTTVFLVFRPDWIRLTDYNTDEPTTVYEWKR